MCRCAEFGGHTLSYSPDSTSPFMGEGGRGCVGPDTAAKQPPPLIPPHKREGVDWILRASSHD